MIDQPVPQQHLLAEFEDLLRTMPAKRMFGADDDQVFSWLGRLASALEQWNLAKGLLADEVIRLVQSSNAYEHERGFQRLMVLLHQARSDLRMKTLGPKDVALPQGGVFDYFDEVRKIVEEATQEVFFVDPYLDADFVSRYLPHVRDAVMIRLLTSNQRLATLLSAVALFAQQSKRSISVHSAVNLHDRYVFIDKQSCYQSGASFKDGAKKAPTTLTQITDAFTAIWQTYESLWASAKTEV